MERPMKNTAQLDRINDISRRLSEISIAYERLAFHITTSGQTTPEMLAMVEMSGEQTIDSLKRSATLLEILRVAVERNVCEPPGEFYLQVENRVFRKTRRATCLRED